MSLVIACRCQEKGITCSAIETDITCSAKTCRCLETDITCSAIAYRCQDVVVPLCPRHSAGVICLILRVSSPVFSCCLGWCVSYQAYRHSSHYLLQLKGLFGRQFVGLFVCCYCSVWFVHVHIYGHCSLVLYRCCYHVCDVYKVCDYFFPSKLECQFSGQVDLFFSWLQACR